MAHPSILDICCNGENSNSLGAKRRVSWLICLSLHALGYYWFGWWGVLLCALSSAASSAMCYFEMRELLWSERDRIRPIS